jgi:HK97 gp10 family phage protein
MGRLMTITVEGADDIISALKRLGVAAETTAAAAAMEGAGLMQTEIERRAPDDSGLLKTRGFTTKRGNMKNGAVNAVVTLARRYYEYAFYNEFGTGPRNPGGVLPARPFIRKAFLAKRQQAAALFEKSLRRRLGL